MTETVERAIDKLAQRIVFCNCATEGPALKRCEHVSLAQQLNEHLLPLLEAGADMRYQEWPADMSFGPAHDWDVALATLTK